MISKAGEPG
jgi:serine/threonine-protein phosphatase 2B catalytic subunit